MLNLTTKILGSLTIQGMFVPLRLGGIIKNIHTSAVHGFVKEVGIKTITGYFFLLYLYDKHIDIHLANYCHCKHLEA